MLTIIFHFIYELLPNTFFSIIAPVNESIWEHMKLIVSPVLFFSIFEYLIYKKKDITVNNFILSYAISCIIGIIIYLLIYIPINDIFGHKAYIAILLLLLTLGLVQYISYYIMNRKKICYSNDIGILMIIIIYFIFGYLTYHPIHINLFYDYMNKVYGLIN